MDDVITEQKKRIVAYLATPGATKADLARRAGLPDTTLIGIDRPGWNPRSETLAKLVRVMDDMGWGLPPQKRPKLRADARAIA